MANNKQKKNSKLVETIIFSILIVAVVFLNSYGPIYLRMIPLLFILGVVGSLFFGRAVITTIFGIITSMCVVHLKRKYGFVENVFVSFNFGLNIALGELAGVLVKKTYKAMKKHKKKFYKKEVLLYILTTVFLFIACPVLHGLSNGNFVRYFNSKQKLESYLKSEYSDEFSNFHILDAEYRLQRNTNYIFKVKYGDRVYNFVVYRDSNLSIIDGYKQSVLENNNNKIKNDFLSFSDSIKKDNLKISFDEKVGSIFLQYTENVDNFTEFNIDSYIEYIIKDLDKIKEFSDINSINKINITIMNTNTSEIKYDTTIDVKEYNKITNDESKKEFLTDSLSIEYIDN